MPSFTNALSQLLREPPKTTSRRAQSRRNAKNQLLDLSKHGELVRTGNGRELAVACRWVGQDYIITRAKYLQPWRDWPAGGPALRAFRAEWRQGTRAMSIAGLGNLGFDFGLDDRKSWMSKLKPCLESVGVVRVVPLRARGARSRTKLFEEDSMIHWAHHIRDGMYDAWAGYKLDKNGDPVWKGQDEDNNHAEGFVPCQYNQVHADGHGVAMVFRFKQAFVDALPYLVTEG